MQKFFKEDFPQMDIDIESLDSESITVRKKINVSHLRPGGTVSGPVLMEVADVAMFVAIINKIGLVALAVTTNLNINFLRKPSANKDVLAECRLIKLGKTLAVAEVSLYSEGTDEPVAHAVGTYSIPPKKHT